MLYFRWNIKRRKLTVLDNNDKIYRRPLKTTDQPNTQAAPPPAAEMMSFTEAISTCFRKYAEFDGCATRAEYWWFILFCIIVIFGCMFVSAGLGCLTVLGLLLPQLSVAVRRLHDINRSGWNCLFNSLPLFGWLILIYLLVQPSAQNGEPKAASSLSLFVIDILASILLIGSFVLIGTYTGFFQYIKNVLYFHDMTAQTQPYVQAVTRCILNERTATGCNAGSNNIPDPITSNTGAVSSLSVTDGMIIVAPIAKDNVSESDTLILTPIIGSDNIIRWELSGAAISKEYVEKEIIHELQN